MIHGQGCKSQFSAAINTTPLMKFNAGQKLFVRTIARGSFLFGPSIVLCSIFGKTEFVRIIFGPVFKLLNSTFSIFVEVAFVYFLTFWTLVVCSTIGQFFIASWSGQGSKKFFPSTNLFFIFVVICKSVFVCFRAVLSMVSSTGFNC